MSSEYFAHESCYIDDGAKIGKNCKIWHFSHVFSGAQIGENCSLGQNVVVHATAVIGKGVKIQNNVSVYDGVVLEDHVFCGPSMVFTNVTNPRSEINRQEEFQLTRVKKGASVGANATIVCGVTIGQYALIAAGSVVTKNVSDHALIMGVPGKQKGWVCRCGTTLSPVQDSLKCENCKQSYRFTKDGLEMEKHQP